MRPFHTPRPRPRSSFGDLLALALIAAPVVVLITGWPL